MLGQIVKIDGLAVATEEAGEFDLYFPNNEPGEYNVLDTDYETFTCIYSCEQVMRG